MLALISITTHLTACCPSQVTNKPTELQVHCMKPVGKGDPPPAFPTHKLAPGADQMEACIAYPHQQ